VNKYKHIKVMEIICKYINIQKMNKLI